jgi:putative DNA primase/helicase
MRAQVSGCCHLPKTKAACLNDWVNKATTDQNQITKWFGNGTAYNIGLAMGVWHTQKQTKPIWCAWTLTCNDKNGLQNWQQLVAENGGNIGQPFIADTATGGLHLVYAVPVKLTNETGALPEHIDVRGHGGYIMTEPSVHPDSGNHKP